MNGGLIVLIRDLRPADLLGAIGPVIMLSVFAFVLYAIHVPIDLLVVIGIGLIYWPFYEVLGALVDHGLTALFRTRDPRLWDRCRNSLFILLVLLVILGLYLYSQWLWLMVLGQCLHLIAEPPSMAAQKEGCLVGLVTFGLLLGVGLLVVFGVPVTLSEGFQFPNVGGDLVYLPGMLILGMGYYATVAILQILKGPALRHFL